MGKEDGKKPLKFKFNHESSNFLEAIGITKEMATKRAREMANFFKTSNKREDKRSQTLENLLSDQFSKEDLAFFLHEAISGNLHVDRLGGKEDEVKVFGGALCPEHAEELFNKLRELGIDVPEDLNPLDSEEVEKMTRAAALQKMFKDLL